MRKVRKLNVYYNETARLAITAVFCPGLKKRYHNTSSVTDMLQNLNWPSLEIRRTRVRLIMFYKIIHHVVAIHPLDTLLLPTTTITSYNSRTSYISTYPDRQRLI